jgi:CO/xanthine dehydrogenase FAD-binding subunit
LAQAISKVALAGVAEIDAGRVTRFGLALASVAPVTCLMPATRAHVLAHDLAALTPDGLDAAVEQDVAPIDDIRSTGDYRMHCSRAVVRGFLRELGAPI